MGIIDAFSAEDRVSVKFSDFYRLMKESAKTELVMNAVQCKVPHKYIQRMATGIVEDPYGWQSAESRNLKNNQL